MDLGVVIVSWNVRSLLDRCLHTLRADLERAAVATEVWVVDNASQDDSASMVRTRHPWVRLAAQRENLGFVRGNNLVLRQWLSTEMPPAVWLLNPDTEVLPGAVTTLLTFLNAHPRAGLIGPRLLNPDGTHQRGAFRFPSVLQPLFDLGYLPARYYESRWNGRYPRRRCEGQAPFRIDHPLGAAMLARGEAIQQVGLLDEAFFMYCEEIDWAWRMRRAGWQAWMVPAAQIVHYGGASTGQARPETTAYLWESRARLYAKHRGPLVRGLVRFIVRRTFTRLTADSPAWKAAYRRIIQAWGG